MKHALLMAKAITTVPINFTEQPVAHNSERASYVGNRQHGWRSWQVPLPLVVLNSTTMASNRQYLNNNNPEYMNERSEW